MILSYNLIKWVSAEILDEFASLLVILHINTLGPKVYGFLGSLEAIVWQQANSNNNASNIPKTNNSALNNKQTSYTTAYHHHSLWPRARCGRFDYWNFALDFWSLKSLLLQSINFRFIMRLLQRGKES